MSQPQHNSGEWPAWATEKILILPPNPEWPIKAIQEKTVLVRQLSALGVTEIEHIGSTAVKDLPAKPVIDLIADIPSFEKIEEIVHILRPSGWHYTPPELDQRPHRRFFIKVENDTRAVHLQFLLSGSPEWKEQIRFRDRLIQDPALRTQYASLKQTSADQYGDDREAYTRSKSAFIALALASPAEHIQPPFQHHRPRNF